MRTVAERLCRGILFVALFAAGGCASFSNPTSFPSVPVRRVPPELLGQSREELRDINYALLRQRQPDRKELDVGDTLGIFIDDVLGRKGEPPPVSVPPAGATYQTIGSGFPVPVMEDGKIVLPLIDPLNVKGKTLTEARAAIIKAYLDKEILKDPETTRFIVTMIRPRTYNVLVVRQDSGSVGLGGNNQLVQSKRGIGQVLELPAYENDVLTAMTRTGGTPGLDARNELIIQRGGYLPGSSVMPRGASSDPNVVRIPLRLRPGEPVPFKPEDVILNSGDVVFIQSRDTELYYTGGLLPAGEFPIPRDYDLDVLKAIAQVRGSIASGGVLFTSFSAGSLVPGGFGNPSPSQLTVLRRAPGNRQIAIRVDLNTATQDPRESILVQPGDKLILQETLGESLTRYTTTTLRLAFNGVFIRQNDVTGSASAVIP